MIEKCNYRKIEELFPWITEHHKKCVISPDLDGLLTSILLSHFLDWHVVGIYTINDLWLSKNHIDYSSQKSSEELIVSNKLIFVDHDIYRKNIFSIGHHLLQWSDETPIPPHTINNNSLNPNLLLIEEIMKYD